MPRPRARPFTSCVLPAPRSPVSPITQPGCPSRPHCSPSAAVSSGLCEMNVAMSGQGTNAFFVTQANAGFGRHLANAGERQVGELSLPPIEQFHRAAAGEGEEQLEIFAIGERGKERRLGGGFRLGPKFGGSAYWNG